MIPIELQAPPPRDLRNTGSLELKKAPNVFGQIAVLLLVPLGFVGWALARDGADADFVTAGAIGLGIDAFLFLFVLAFSIQRTRGARLFREGVATIGVVRKMDTPDDGRGAAYAFLQVDYQDARGQMHTGKFSTMGAVSEMDARPGAQIAILYLPNTPRFCAFYTPGMGIVPGRAPS